jgi:hypothetical protein
LWLSLLCWRSTLPPSPPSSTCHTQNNTTVIKYNYDTVQNTRVEENFKLFALSFTLYLPQNTTQHSHTHNSEDQVNCVNVSTSLMDSCLANFCI